TEAAFTKIGDDGIDIGMRIPEKFAQYVVIEPVAAPMVNQRVGIYAHHSGIEAAAEILRQTVGVDQRETVTVIEGIRPQIHLAGHLVEASPLRGGFGAVGVTHVRSVTNEADDDVIAKLLPYRRGGPGSVSDSDDVLTGQNLRQPVCRE